VLAADLYFVRRSPDSVDVELPTGFDPNDLSNSCGEGAVYYPRHVSPSARYDVISARATEGLIVRERSARAWWIR